MRPLADGRQLGRLPEHCGSECLVRYVPWRKRRASETVGERGNDAQWVLI